jgi:hypothetical protein
LTRRFSPAIADVLRDREAEAEQFGRDLMAELAKTAVAAERAWAEVPSLVELVRQGGDEVRLKLRAVLRRVVEAFWLLVVTCGSWRLCVVQGHFHGGASRSWLIVYRPAVRCRAGTWQVRSFATAGIPALDLRRREDAGQLLKVLEAVRPEELSGG